MIIFISHAYRVQIELWYFLLSVCRTDLRPTHLHFKWIDGKRGSLKLSEGSFRMGTRNITLFLRRCSYSLGLRYNEYYVNMDVILNQL